MAVSVLERVFPQHVDAGSGTFFLSGDEARSCRGPEAAKTAGSSLPMRRRDSSTEKVRHVPFAVGEPNSSTNKLPPPITSGDMIRRMTVEGRTSVAFGLDDLPLLVPQRVGGLQVVLLRRSAVRKLSSRLRQLLTVWSV
jgi:hypothetical protein